MNKKTILLTVVAFLSLSTMAVNRKETRESMKREWKPITSQLRATTNLLDSIISIGDYDDFKEEYTYDDNGNQKQSISYHRDKQTGRWTRREIFEHEYDAGNNLKMSTVYYFWDSANSRWIVEGKREYAYDDDGNPKLEAYYRIDSKTGQFNIYSKYEFTFEDNHVLAMSFTWDSVSGRWKERSKIEHTRDENGNPTQRIYYDWNNQTGQWEERDKDEYTYDNNGNQIMSVSYDWNNSDNQWKETYKEESAYDDRNNLTMEISYQWDSKTGQWKQSYKDEYEYTYNSDGTISILKNFSVNSYGTRDLEWTDYYYYSQHEVANMNTPQSTDILVFPNPVVNSLHIKVENNTAVQVNLYNLHGQLLLQTNEIEIDFSAYPAGIYILDVNGKQIKIVR